MQYKQFGMAAGMLGLMAATTMGQRPGGGGCGSGGGSQARAMVGRSGGGQRLVVARGSSGGATVVNALPSGDFWRMFDADASGTLNANERAALAMALRQRGVSAAVIAQGLARLAALEQFDADRDGVVSASERQAAVVAKKTASAKRPPASRRQAEILARFDTNQDGELSGAEKVAMWKELAAERELAAAMTPTKSASE